MSFDEQAHMAKLRESLASGKILVRSVPSKNSINDANRRRFREILLDVHGPHCWLCNRRIVDETPTLDHIVPRSLGGPNGIVNVRLAHQRCNSKRGNGPVPELLLTRNMRLDRSQGWQSPPRSKPLVETPKSDSMRSTRAGNSAKNPSNSTS